MQARQRKGLLCELCRAYDDLFCSKEASQQLQARVEGDSPEVPNSAVRSRSRCNRSW